MLEFKTKPRLSEPLAQLKSECLKNKIPTILDDSLSFLLVSVSMNMPKSILEIGTAFGLSGSAMLNADPYAHLTTLENDDKSYEIAKGNFQKFGLSERVTQYLVDAGEYLNYTNESFDFIFLDGAKARYLDYLPDLKRILKKNGVLLADNVLFRGFIEGKVKFDHRENTIVRNMREFINKMIDDEDFIVSLNRIGDGVLLAYKK